MLQAKDVHFCIRKKPIIDQVSVDLVPGQLTVILGPNGAGKSTLFKILSGELPCKHGNINYNGRPVNEFKSKQLAQIRAVMPQHSTLSFPFTALEIVELGLLPLDKKHTPTLIEDVMRETQTWEMRGQLYGNLSGGEKQRVQLARVLVQVWERKPFPRYLLLDEPTSSMDIALQHHVLHIMHAIKSRNIGVLAVLHDLNLAANYADHIILMKNGMIHKQGSCREIMTSENLETVFGHPIQVLTTGESESVMIQSLPFRQSKHQIKHA